MYFRTTIWKRIINEFNNEVFEKSYSICKQYNRDFFYYNDVKILIAGKTLEELQKEYKVNNNFPFLLVQLNAMAMLFDTRFQNDDICVYHNNDTIEFISSDNPVIAFNKGIIIPVSPENTMFLPLDNRHILCLLSNENPLGSFSIFRRQIVDKEEIKEYNSMQKVCCERFVLGNTSSLSEIQ